MHSQFSLGKVFFSVFVNVCLIDWSTGCMEDCIVYLYLYSLASGCLSCALIASMRVRDQSWIHRSNR